jgi:hypothetical protein
MQEPRKAAERSALPTFGPRWPSPRAWSLERLYWQFFDPPALTDAVRATRRYARSFSETPPKRHLDAFQAGYEGRAYDGPDTEAYRTGCKARPCTSEAGCVSCECQNSTSGPRPVTAGIPFYAPGLPFGWTCPDSVRTGSASCWALTQVQPFSLHSLSKPTSR